MYEYSKLVALNAYLNDQNNRDKQKKLMQALNFPLTSHSINDKELLLDNIVNHIESSKKSTAALFKQEYPEKKDCPNEEDYPGPFQKGNFSALSKTLNGYFKNCKNKGKLFKEQQSQEALFISILVSMQIIKRGTMTLSDIPTINPEKNIFLTFYARKIITAISEHLRKEKLAQPYNSFYAYVRAVFCAGLDKKDEQREVDRIHQLLIRLFKGTEGYNLLLKDFYYHLNNLIAGKGFLPTSQRISTDNNASLPLQDGHFPKESSELGVLDPCQNAVGYFFNSQIINKRPPTNAHDVEDNYITKKTHVNPESVTAPSTHAPETSSEIKHFFPAFFQPTPAFLSYIAKNNCATAMDMDLDLVEDLNKMFDRK
ncbi:MAG: hypothetical protein H2069_09605 [Legionella sp.]|nr:hypothetical protein [Legionella sp.]